MPPGLHILRHLGIYESVYSNDRKGNTVVFKVSDTRLPGPAPVDPGNSKVGTASASLEKYIFNYRYIKRLETDRVVGEFMEKRG